MISNLVIEHVNQIGIEGVKVVELWKLGKDQGQFLAEVGLRELHLPHVETSNPRDLVVPVNHRGRLPLGFGQYNVCEVLGRGDHGDLLEIVEGHDDHSPSTVLKEVKGHRMKQLVRVNLNSILATFLPSHPLEYPDNTSKSLEIESLPNTCVLK